jgi:hypothetical protein
MSTSTTDVADEALPTAETKNWRPAPRELLLVLATAVITVALTLIVVNTFSFGGGSTAGPAFTQKTSGQLAMTEAELKEAVRTLGVPVYWSGPQQGSLYSLDSRIDGQIFVRYLPDEESASDTTPRFRVIATYTLEDAVEATKAAGQLENGIGFTNADGAAVYYNRLTPTNVYIAFERSKQQIEIFDPAPGVALELATVPGSIKLVK